MKLYCSSFWNKSGDQRRLCLYAALFLPFRDTVHRENNEEKKIPVVTRLLLRDIKGLRDISFTEPNLPELEKRTRLFKRIEDKILELGLEEVWKMKLLLNGFDIKDILGLKKRGPIVGEWKQALFRWQLAHPSGTADAFIV